MRDYRNQALDKLGKKSKWGGGILEASAGAHVLP
jgi:hypothetical protein